MDLLDIYTLIKDIRLLRDNRESHSGVILHTYSSRGRYREVKFRRVYLNWY